MNFFGGLVILFLDVIRVYAVVIVSPLRGYCEIVTRPEKNYQFTVYVGLQIVFFVCQMLKLSKFAPGGSFVV